MAERMQGGGKTMTGHVRVRAGRRPRPRRDPRTWRRTRQGRGTPLGLGDFEAAGELAAPAKRAAADKAAAELAAQNRTGDATRRPGDAALDSRDRYLFPEEFPEGPYGMNPDNVPDTHRFAKGQTALGRAAEGLDIEAYRYDQDYGPVTGTVADEPPEARQAEIAALSEPSRAVDAEVAGRVDDEPSD